MDLHDHTYNLIERAARRGADIVNGRRDFEFAGVALAATQSGTFSDPDIDPLTGYPFEPERSAPAGVFMAGDLVGVKPVGKA